MQEAFDCGVGTDRRRARADDHGLHRTVGIDPDDRTLAAGLGLQLRQRLLVYRAAHKVGGGRGVGVEIKLGCGIVHIAARLCVADQPGK